MLTATGLVLMTALATSAEAPAEFVPGEVMVKFVSGSEADKIVTRVGEQSPLRLEDLEPVARDLEARTAIPLAATQLTGGKWVVLKVDVDRLNARVLERLRSHRSVTQADPTGEDRQYIGYAPPKKITVKFEPGSAEAKTVSERLRNRDATDFADLVTTLERKVDAPLQCEATPPEELLVQLDLRSLTLTLQERLRSLPSIEDTQLNHVMKAF